MTFDQALGTQPEVLRLWVLWMGGVIFASLVILMTSTTTRRDALIIFLTNLGVYASMMWLYHQVGFVRLLGLVHVVFWTPLAIYLWTRLKSTDIVSPYRQIMWLLLATMIVSLAFDYFDVVRYLLGDRASMIR